VLLLFGNCTRKEVFHILRIAKRFAKPYRRYFIIGPAAKLTEAILELISPLLMAMIIDNGLENGGGYVIRNAVLMILCGIAGLGFALICQYMGSRASQDVGTDIRNVLFEKVNTYSDGNLDRLPPRTLITRLNNDVNQVQTAVAMFIRLAVRAPFLVIGAAVMAMFIDLKLSVIFIVLIPLIVLILWAVTMKTVPMYGKVQKLLDRLTGVFGEHISGVRVIRAFGNEDLEEQRFDEKNRAYRAGLIKTGLFSALTNPLTFALTNLSIAFILYTGGIQIRAGSLTTGELIAFIGYLTQISLALGVVANLITIFTKAQASARRINEALDEVPDVENGDKTVSIANTNSKNNAENAPLLRFDHVHFRFPDARNDALTDINFTLEQGETLGIIGFTGSGKSALVGLIPRFYDVTAGSVSLLGTDVKNLELSALRETVRVIPQKSVLFSGTIADNLRFGHKNADSESCRAALKYACMGDFDPDSPVSAGGKNFSGGQRGRLCIARAIIHDDQNPPRILIADDSFSALDRLTESKVRENLREALPGTAMIIITERINFVKNADKILVLEDGKAAGFGTHEELIAGSEHYRGIYETQNEVE
jgi:ATP-binding cassette subfamily B protein